MLPFYRISAKTTTIITTKTKKMFTIHIVNFFISRNIIWKKSYIICKPLFIIHFLFVYFYIFLQVFFFEEHNGNIRFRQRYFGINSVWTLMKFLTWKYLKMFALYTFDGIPCNWWLLPLFNIRGATDFRRASLCVDYLVRLCFACDKQERISLNWLRIWIQNILWLVQ